MPNIVPSLFGLNPEQVRQARSSDIQAGAANFAQLSPMQQAQSMLYQGGAGLGQAAGGMFGFVDPMMEQAKSRQQIGTQMDMSSPQGYYAAAQQAQARGDIELATNLVATGRELEQSMTTDQFKVAQAQRMSQGRPVSAKTTKAVVDRNGENWNALIDSQTGDVVRYLSKVAGKESKVKPKELSTLRSLDDQVFNLKKASEEIKNHPGLGGATGLASGVPSAYGSEAKKAENLLNEFSANVKQAGLQLVRSGGSIGQITQSEWNIVEGMVASIDPAAGAEAVRSQIDKVNAKIDQVYENAKMAYSEQYGEEYKPKERGTKQKTPSGAVSLEDYLKSQGL